MKAYLAPSSPIWNELNMINEWQKGRSLRCLRTQIAWKAFCIRLILSDNCTIVYIMEMWVICLTYYPSDIIHCSWWIYCMDLFWISSSTYDDIPYKYPQIKKMFKDIVELTLAPLWHIVIFHSVRQALSVTIALNSRCNATEHMHWQALCYYIFNVWILWCSLIYIILFRFNYKLGLKRI